MLKSSFLSCSRRCTKIQKVTGIGKSTLLVDIEALADDIRTIHGMVYNAMKLFMEINPQLFDECSHEYTEQQSNADQKQQARKDKWDRLAEQARQKQNGGSSATLISTTLRGSTKVNTPMRMDEVDPMTQDSQKRLDALRIQDEGTNGREQRRPREHDRQNSVGNLTSTTNEGDQDVIGGNGWILECSY